MSELNPPGVIDGPEAEAETGAQVQRLAHYALAGGRQGVCGATDLAVSQSSTPGMTVRVAAGVALVNGSSVSYQGTYSCPVTAAVDDLAIAAGDPTNPRNDIIVAQVIDATYAGADKLWQLAVVQGTPAGSPSDPTLPASSLALARVRVDANESTSILNADITDLRVRAGDWAQSWGRVASQEIATNSGAFTNAYTDMLTLTWTAVAGRRYRLFGKALFQSTVADDLMRMVLTNSSDSILQMSQAVGPLANQAVDLRTDVELTGLSGSVTSKMRAIRVAGSGNITRIAASTWPSILRVDDIGPA